MAFKKPLSTLKTSAPLKSSDRRKLKQRVVQAFNLESPDEGEILVPEGLLSVKFTTHLNEPGIAYLAPDGSPLWFTIGKGSDDLIPTVYTLWKRPQLLPFLSTPSAVIPRLTDGADLMIPGVVQHMPGLRTGQLVSIAQYEPGMRGPPLAVGHMAVDAERMGHGAKGKAVIVIHTLKDKLWEMGGKGDPPAAVPMEGPAIAEHEGREEGDEQGNAIAEGAAGSDVDDAQVTPPPLSEPEDTADGKPDVPTLTPQEVSAILRTSLIQSIHSTLSLLPPASFPLPSTTLYTSHILPSRPLPNPSSPPTPIDIKHSSYKSLTAFLRAAEKEGLLKLKESKGKGAGDALIVGVFGKHDDVQAHTPYRTRGEEEARRERREVREENERKQGSELTVEELWKPHQQSVQLFAEAGKDTSALYTHSEIKAVLNAYIAAKLLMNAHQQQYINVDDLLRVVLSSAKAGEAPEFLKREEATQQLVEKMQAWHRIGAEGQEPVLKKGQLKPVSVVVKIRQGRKACTLLTNFEPFFLVADALADELRKLCASATTVTQLPGKGAGLEVMIQGKQIKTVAELLMAKGVPKKWVETADLSVKKK